MLIIVAFFIGMTVGYSTGSQPIAEVPKAIAGIGGIVGVFVLIIKTLSDYFKETLFEFGIVFKTNDKLPTWEKKPSFLRGTKLEQTGEIDVTGYYIRIFKKRGNGRLEDCEGLITIKIPNGEEMSFPTVWRGASYSRYRSIGIQDDLKLFFMFQDDKKIQFFTHYETHDSKVETETITSDLDNDGLNTEISVKLGSSKGNVPKEINLGTVSKIINDSKYTF